MDRTREFWELAGVVASPSGPTLLGSDFIRTATDLRYKLGQLRRRMQYDNDQSDAIRSCQDQVAGLEHRVNDIADLGARAPRQRRDLLAHRRGAVGALYEDLKDLASRCQSVQVTELQREAEVASYFAAPDVSTVKLTVPPARSPSTSGPRASASSSAAANSGDGFSVGDMAALPPDDRLKAEGAALLTAFRSDMDQIQSTEKKLENVVALVSLFSTKVHEQQEQAEHIQELAEESTEHVANAEKQLQKAVSNSNAYRFYVVCWFVGSALSLLVFDFIDARYSWI